MFNVGSRPKGQSLAAAAVTVVVSWVLSGSVSAQAKSASVGEDPAFRLTATVNAPGVHQDLKVWALHDLARFKHAIARERDPRSGKVIKSEGFLLANLIDQTLESLPAESRAQIDLIVLKGRSGEQALVPRALMTKYPLMVATRQESAAQKTEGPLSVVVPWTSKPSIQNEGLPLESFFVSGLKLVELTNYRHQFGSLFLKRRTDPSAMRGERLFVQSCAGCHDAGKTQNPFAIVQGGIAKRFFEKGHPGSGLNFRVNDRDRGAILRYAEALQGEHQDKITQVEQPNLKTKDL